MLEYMVAGLEPWVALVLLIVSAGASFITAAFGIGGGGVMLAVLATLLPPAAIIPVHAVVQFGSNAGRAALFLRHMRWELFGAFAAGTVLGIGLGGAFVVQLHPGWLQIAVGAFILWSVVGRPPGFLKRSGLIAGAFSSFLTMFIGGTGPFVATYVKAQGYARHDHVATQAVLMTLQHGLKCVAFGVLGFAFAVWAGFIAALVLAGFVGTWTGKRMLARIDEALFSKVLSAILIVLSLRLIWAGAELVWTGADAGIR
ncbi:sulfite exporter TauE/SafE family protein [Psychromarinibacter sp. C21-152]|uniref:Probable membrane transporter protein n=1 Tax=Psychromarinibacter sediminicola TaxID=3033385 RepID=A0AAE3NLZ5_9RHOB|nr:sulfite exporter TauE/SafE family protein [Psychromarinibacter sediminicola]MDF0599758.1 sulfite exporter TauE/SafE family protein [Psychromarinibacter sediminicola]